MEDYRLTLLADLESKIAQAKELLLDPAYKELAQQELESLEKQKLEIEKGLNFQGNSPEKTVDSYDNRNIILQVSGAAGGEEAKLWGEELLRMYARYAQQTGFKVETLDEDVIKIIGKGAFGRFKYEAGVHRVQRTPITEKRGRIHTSTATISILPELEDIDLHISPEEIEFEAFRAGGHGGQNVNKVSTAVRVKHIPSGIVVTCSMERSQSQNREIAMELLRAQLWEREIEKQQSEIASIRSTQVGRGMRSEKIRTYNFPQDRLTDHRINTSWHNLPSLLEGNIDEVVNAMSQLEQKQDTSKN